MPRKENGFGKTNSFDFKDFKDFGRVDKGKGKGSYQSNRTWNYSDIGRVAAQQAMKEGS